MDSIMRCFGCRKENYQLDTWVPLLVPIGEFIQFGILVLSRLLRKDRRKKKAFPFGRKITLTKEIIIRLKYFISLLKYLLPLQKELESFKVILLWEGRSTS